MRIKNIKNNCSTKQDPILPPETVKVFIFFFNLFQGVNIPMSPKMLNKLIDKLDADGDGEVDFRFGILTF